MRTTGCAEREQVQGWGVAVSGVPQRLGLDQYCLIFSLMTLAQNSTRANEIC